MNKIPIVLIGWIFLLAGCGMVNTARNYSKYPECQSETTQGDWAKCLKEKYGIEGGFDAYGIYNTKTGGIWDWKKEETKKEETIIPSIEDGILEKEKPSPTKKPKEIIPDASVASTTGQYIPQLNAPAWNIADIWIFQQEDRKSWINKVIKVEDDHYVVEDSSKGDFVAYDKNTLNLKFYIGKEGKRIKPTDTFITMPTAAFIYLNFPLHLGKKWTRTVTTTPARRSSIPTNFLEEFECISWEKVTVSAGTFETIKIKLKSTIMSSRMSSGVAYIWYSPELKSPIKINFEKSLFWSPERQNYELISFNLKEKQPPSPEVKSHSQKVDIPSRPQPSPPEKPQTVTPIPSPTITPPPVLNTVVVTGTSANIRSGAGNEFSIVTTVKQGDKLILLGEYGEWFNVRLENGQEGWINNRFAK